jgi:hypothetical protein
MKFFQLQVMASLAYQGFLHPMTDDQLTGMRCKRLSERVNMALIIDPWSVHVKSCSRTG